MLDKYLISYNHEESIIHNINAVVKIISFVLYLIACFFKFDNILFIFFISWNFMLLLLSNISILRYLKVLWKYKYLLIILYYLLYCMNLGLVFVNVIIFKVIFALLNFYMIIFTTKKEDLCKGLGLIFNVFKNKKIVSNFFNNIYSFFIIFIEEVNITFEMNCLKGTDCCFVTIIDKIRIFGIYFKDIFNNAKIKNNQRKLCMKYRLFDLKESDNYKYYNKLTVFDYILVLFYICLYVYYIIKVR